MEQSTASFVFSTTATHHGVFRERSGFNNGVPHIIARVNLLLLLGPGFLQDWEMGMRNGKLYTWAWPRCMGWEMGNHTVAFFFCLFPWIDENEKMDEDEYY